MTRVKVVPVAAITVLAMAVYTAACSDNNGASRARPTTTTTSAAAGVSGISEQRAIEVALEAWGQQDSEFDSAAVRPEADPIAGTYDVALVPKDITGKGGEPHVVVEPRDGQGGAYLPNEVEPASNRAHRATECSITLDAALRSWSRQVIPNGSYGVVLVLAERGRGVRRQIAGRLPLAVVAVRCYVRRTTPCREVSWRRLRSRGRRRARSCRASVAR